MELTTEVKEAQIAVLEDLKYSITGWIENDKRHPQTPISQSKVSGWHDAIDEIDELLEAKKTLLLSKMRLMIN